MEPQTRFNLDQAVAAWRAELAAHPGPAPDDLRALEAHLRDGFAALQGGQLSDEEAFLIARHRVGPSEPIADEFAKVASRRVWGPRVFWLAFGVLAMQFWDLVFRFSPPLGPTGVSVADNNWMVVLVVILGFVSPLMHYIVPPVLAAFWLAYGVPNRITRLLSTRLRVAAMSMGLCLFGYALYFWAILHTEAWSTIKRWGLNHWIDSVQWMGGGWTFRTPEGNLLYYYVWPAFLIGVIIWLAPGQTRALSKAKMSTV